MKQSHAQRVHLSYLDAARLSQDRHSKSDVRRAESDAEEMVKLALALFGEVSVMAHEVLDIPALRAGRLRPLLEGRNARLSVVGWQDTFSKTLCYNLRRHGENAFIFDSVREGAAAAQEWSRIAADLVNKSDAEVLRAAQDFEPYQEIVSAFESLARVAVLLASPDVPELHAVMSQVGPLMTGVAQPPRGWPRSLSEAHHLGRDLHGDTTDDFNAFLAPYEFASRIRYSALTEAIPFLDCKRVEDGGESIEDAPLIRATISGDLKSFIFYEDKYRVLASFRSRLRSVAIPEFLYIVDDPVIERLRADAWAAVDQQMTGTERLLNGILEQLDARLPSADLDEKPQSGSVGAFGVTIPKEWLSLPVVRYFGRRRRAAMHEVVSYTGAKQERRSPAPK